MDLADHPVEDLPDLVDLTQQDIDDCWDLMLWWRATGKKHLPSEVKKQDLRELSTILKLDSLLEKTIKQLDKKDNDG